MQFNEYGENRMKESRLAARPCKASGCKQRNGKRRNTRHPSGICEQCRTPAYETTRAAPKRETAMLKHEEDHGTASST